MDAVPSMLFTPGHRSDLIGKAARSPADAVIVDLEDGDQRQERRALQSRLLAWRLQHQNRCGHSIGRTLPVSFTGGLLRGGICTCLRMTK